MEQFIGCDAHKKFSLFIAMNQEGGYGKPMRIPHDRDHMRAFLEALPAASKIALETSGSYYWLVDEIERAGHEPQLAHALTAKRRMEGRHKTDERDARGLAMLLRNGTLPRVWIPPAELRDWREMLRWRMCLVESRSQIKNRIHGVLLRYNVEAQASDLYGVRGRAELEGLLAELPQWTRQSVNEQLETIDHLDRQIEDCEQKLEVLLEASAERDLLNTLPGVGRILSAVIALERGQEKPSATTNGTEKFTGYFRDAETQLDYADQRYHQPGMGRFLTVDPYKNSAGPKDPSTRSE